MDFDTAKFEKVINRVLPGLTMFVHNVRVAECLGVEPRKLPSHVRDYRITDPLR